MFRVGCDIGGTFTDFVLLDESTGEIFVEKGLTTPEDPSVEIMAGLAVLERIARGYAAEARFVAHATTLVANAVIERKGARTALLTTRGFRDVLELRRHVRVTTYELWADPPEPLVPRFLRIPVAERTGGDGRVITPVDRGEIEAIAHRLRSEGVESVAIAFLHAYANSTNELEAGRLLAEFAPEIAVTTSSSVLPQIKEFERTSAAVVNAYVKPLARRYLRRLDGGIRALGFRAPLRIMLSTGGVASAETAGEFPVRLIESGPVAGAIIARHYASLGGIDGARASDVLSFDMGGTTAKACLVREHELPITDELEVARSRRFTKSSGYPVPVPAVDLMEIGAGGGSIASVNALGLVQVGPESAGANPGPICYGRGGARPTVTDADLVLGYLNPEYFAGGTIRLDAEGAGRGIERDLARPLGRDLVAAAWTVHDVVNETMAAAVRIHVTERGGNPERATLFAFGGAGPVHAYHMAATLGIPRMIVPLRAGVLSALGLVIAPVSFDLVRTHKLALGQLQPTAIDAIFRDMSEEVRQTLDKAQPGAPSTFTRAVDIGYIGQGYQVTVPVDDSTVLDPAELWRRFAAVYRDKYGYFYDDVPAELVNLRVSGRLCGVDMTLPRLDAARPSLAAPKDERRAYSRRRGRMIPFAVYDRSELGPGTSIAGPAIIEEASATTIVDDRGSVAVDEWGSLVVTVAVVEDGGAS